MGNRRNAVYILLIVSLVAGLLSGRVILFTLAYTLGGLLTLSLVWSWSSVSWIRIQRQTRSRRGQVGKLFEESFGVSNTAVVPKLWLEIEDHSTLPDYRASRVVPGMLPLQSQKWSASTVCTTRGQFRLGPLTVISGDPFGLFRFPRLLEATSQLVVYPAVVPIRAFAVSSGVLSGGDAQRQRTHFVTTNAAGVREYAPGDSFNRIHWRSTAHKARLLVKEFELDPQSDIWVFLDLSASSRAEQVGIQYVNGTLLDTAGYGWLSGEFVLPASTEEYGIVIAASLAHYFLDKGRSLGFLTYGPHREILHPDRSQRQLNQILELLAVVTGGGDFDIEHMLTLNTAVMASGTTLVVITADQTEHWVRHAQVLSRRGIRIVAILLDPSSFGGTIDTQKTEARLATFHAPTYVVRAGDELSGVLSQSRI